MPHPTLTASRTAADSKETIGAADRPSLASRPRIGGVPGAAIVAVGAGLAFIVGHDGSPPVAGGACSLAVLLTTMAVLTASATVHGRLRGSVTFGIGVLATSIGVGIGVPHVAKSGPHGLTVAGMLTLVAGLVLLASGAVTLVASVRLRWRVPVALALLVVVFLSVWCLAQPVAATNVPRNRRRGHHPGRPRSGPPGRGTEDFRDGVTLSGWYLPSANGAAVVPAARGGFDPVERARPRHRPGPSPGTGSSWPTPGAMAAAEDGPWTSAGTATSTSEAAVSFLEAPARRGDGAGWPRSGCPWAAKRPWAPPRPTTGCRPSWPRGPQRVPADKAWLSEAYGWRGQAQEALEGQSGVRRGRPVERGRRPEPLALRAAVAAAAPRPVLLIAAGDVADEPKADRYIQGGSPGTVELWVVPDSGHTDALATHPEAWEARVTDFLDAALESS